MKIELPNAILDLRWSKVETKPDYIAVFVRNKDRTWNEEAFGTDYKKTTNPTDLDPVVNWLDWVPNLSWVHPAIFDKKGKEWAVRAVGDYHVVILDGEPTSTDNLHSKGLLFPFFDRVLDSYADGYKV